MMAMVMRACPASWRFRAAVALAHLLEPLIARTRGCRERQRLRTETVRETSLEFVLMMLTRHGTTFAPEMTIEGLECLPSPGERATVIVGPHTMLSRLFVRYLEAAGHEPAVIDAAPQFVYGTRWPQRILFPSPTLLFQVRRVMRQSGIVMALIDGRGRGRRGRVLQVRGGELIVSDVLLQFALRQRARVVFLATTLDGHRRVVVKLGAAPRDAETVDDLVLGFASFVDRALCRSGSDYLVTSGRATT